MIDDPTIHAAIDHARAKVEQLLKEIWENTERFGLTSEQRIQLSVAVAQHIGQELGHTATERLAAGARKNEIDRICRRVAKAEGQC